MAFPLMIKKIKNKSANSIINKEISSYFSQPDNAGRKYVTIIDSINKTFEYVGFFSGPIIRLKTPIDNRSKSTTRELEIICNKNEHHYRYLFKNYFVYDIRTQGFRPPAFEERTEMLLKSCGNKPQFNYRKLSFVSGIKDITERLIGIYNSRNLISKIIILKRDSQLNSKFRKDKTIQKRYFYY